MLKTDSRKITKGDTFLALKGVVTDGHDYIEQAILNGASKVICERGSYDVETLIVPDTRVYLAKYLKDTYKKQLDSFKFIGITGTNGKTTSAYLIYQLLNKLGKKTAYIGTIGFYVDDTRRELNNTTPDLMDLYDMFLDCYDKNVEVIVMEVSSHALELGRVLDLEFDVVAFTNLTQDHLDVHGSFENYLNAKQKLFKMVKNDGVAIVNIDDSYGDKFLFESNFNVTYGIKPATYQILDYDLKINKTKFTLKVSNNSYDITLPIPGKYNMYNFLVALISAVSLGYDIEDVLKKIDLIKTPKGRFDIINYNSNVIVVDYAHTPDAVLNILKSVLEYREGKVYTIIGCGGDRDRTKRPIMGDIATTYSDYVIFTNDNPRCEDEKQIMDDIVCNLDRNNYEIIYDRKLAIEKGISLLKEKDILLILGKGHEDYQIIGKEKTHFDDKEVVLEIIK
ncbi:MAG: UDP-N-acetylmuramoyl-L-alanyl-D-glutamate--2,6-diaminopimelate ligase [Bacilli bacterium]